MTRRALAHFTNRCIRKMCCLAVILVVAVPLSTPASDSELSRGSLKGISAVTVLVEDLDNGAAVLGLTKETIQTDVELKLRLAGVRVVTDREGALLPGQPYLYVQITTTDDARAVAVAVELFQDVSLERNETVTIAGTWSVLGILSNPTLRGTRDFIKQLTDRFLNAWLSVNPKS